MSQTPSSPLLRQAIRGSVYSGLGTVATFVLGFIFAGLTIRYLGNERAGYLMTVQAIIGLNALLGGLGLGTPLIQRSAQLAAAGDHARISRITGAVSSINLISGVLFAAGLVAAFPLLFHWSRLNESFRADAFGATVLWAVTFFLTQWGSQWQAVYQGLQRFDLITYLGATFGLLNGLAGITVLKLLPTMTAIAAVGSGVTALRFVCDACLMKRLLHVFPWPRWCWAEIRPMVGFGGWNYVGNLGILLSTNVDRLILTTFLGSVAMPFYALPQRLFLQTHTALTSQCQFLFPMLSSFGEKASAQIEALEDRLHWFVAMLSGTAYLGLALVAPVLLERLVNKPFALAVSLPLALACLQGFIHSQDILPYYGSWALGQGAPNALMPLVNGILVALSSIILIPKLGVVGASLSQLWIVPVVAGHIYWVRRIISPRANPWKWLRALISPLLMMVTWYALVKVGHYLFPGQIMFFFLCVFGGIIGLALVWLVEQQVFPQHRRWSTLSRALGLLVNRAKGIVAIERPPS